MKQSGWPLLLFREEAAVTVAVNEGKYGRNKLFNPRPIQAPEKPLSTAEYLHSGKHTQKTQILFFSLFACLFR
jgi:hypothetical protein